MDCYMDLEERVKKLAIVSKAQNDESSVCSQPESQQSENILHTNLPSLEELEIAAQIILALPNIVTEEQRKSAEQIFINFRQASFELCKNILKFSENDLVLLETCGIIKNALIREWSTLLLNEAVILRKYLYTYIINKPNLASFVRDKMLHIIVIIMKKTSLDGSDDKNRDILNDVEKFIVDGDLTMKILGCRIILTLIQEYAYSIEPSEIGLTKCTNFKAKQMFETTFLKRTFQFCIQALQELIKADSIPENMLILIQCLLFICESILSWDFVCEKNSSELELSILIEEENPNLLNAETSLQPTKDWNDIILDPAVVELFFNIYWKVHTNLQLAEPVRNCLYRLATLEGVLIDNSETHLNYLRNYFINFLKLLSRVELIDQEIKEIAKIFKHLIHNFQSIINKLPEDLQKNFIEQFLRLTCLLAEKTSQEELTYADDCLFMEAFVDMLQAWLFIMSSSNLTLFTQNFYEINSVQIFNTYLQCHLKSPDGVRRNVDEKFNDRDVIKDLEANLLKYNEYLHILGQVGRYKFVLPHVLPLLSRLVEEHTEKLKEQLNFVISDPDHMVNVRMSHIQNIYEDLYWLVIVSGHLLCCMEYSDFESRIKGSQVEFCFSQGRRIIARRKHALMSEKTYGNNVPKKILQYTTELMNKGLINTDLSLEYLISRNLNILHIDNSEQSIDPTIRLITAIFRLSDVENIVINTNSLHFLSFKLCYINIWFLQRWSFAYFGPIILGDNILAKAFVREKSNVLRIQNFLADKILYNMKAFKNNILLINETMYLLKVLICSKNKIFNFRKIENFNSFVELGMNNKEIPRDVKRNLMCAISTVLSEMDAFDLRISEKTVEKYFERVLKPMRARLQNIILLTLMPNSYYSPETLRIETIDILESFIGIMQGERCAEFSETVVEYLYQVLSELPNLLTHFHNDRNVIELILEVFCNSFRSQTRCYNYFDSYYKIIKAYTNCNQNRVIIEASKDDSFEDFLLIMKILQNVSDKIHLHAFDVHFDTTFEDVYLPILSILIPLMATELIKFPELCVQFFNTMNSICYTFEEKLFTIPLKLLKQFFTCIEYGLSSIQNGVKDRCCKIISIMSKIFCLDIIEAQPDNQLMAPFLNLLFKVTLTQDLLWSQSSDIGYSLYYLICCYQEKYQRLIENIINSNRTEHSIAEELEKAFDKLNYNVKFDANSQGGEIFMVNLYSFFIEIRNYQKWIRWEV